MLGTYRIRDELGSGGMGTVWLAEDGDGRPCAVKVIHSHLLEAPGFFKRFLREAEIGKAVRHPNVVRCYDVDALLVDGRQQNFLVMEFVEGQTLRRLLEELERVPEELCRHIGREVAKGLAAIHEAGVVHRDLKPENVLITPDHEVKVMDLGVARLADEAVRLSQTGAFVGSPHYAAPEQFRGGGDDLDGRADLHALGLILYELSSGQHPYLADDIPKVLQKLLNEKPRRLSQLNPQLSPFFEELVHTLISKDREKRLESAMKLLTVLEQGEESTWWGRRAKAIRAETKRPLRRMRIPRETEVYGRETELAKLEALFGRAKDGEGQIVLIDGEAGIGKTRLVDELIGRLCANGEDLNFLFGSYPPGGAATASGAWSTAYREHFGPDGSAPWLTETPILVPAFDALLKGEPPPKGSESLTKDSLQTVFVHATRALAEERMTVVLIEDLHFSPEEGRAMFASLSHAVPGHRILLIGTARPGIPEDWRANLERLEHAHRIELSRLGPKDLARLLEDAFHSERLTEELGIRIAKKSDGNPFFVFEIIRGLRDGKFITRKPDGTWASTRVIAEIEVPSSVQDLIQARISDLTEEEREILDVAACLGFEFDPRLVAEVLGLRPVPALRRLAHLESPHRLVRSLGRNYAFDHHQVQESLYAHLNENLREEYHGAIAEAIEAREGAAEKDPESVDGALCVDLCEHYLKGARGEAALRYLAAAQTHLTKGYLHAQVVSLTERTLAVPDLLSGTERAKALLQLADALDPMGRPTRQEECTREAERLAKEADDGDLIGRATIRLASQCLQTSRLVEAETAFRRAQELAVLEGDKRADAAATNGLGSVCYSQGRLSEARTLYERTLALTREREDRAHEAGSIVNLGNVLLTQASLPAARERFESGIAICREIGHLQFEAAASVGLGSVFLTQGRLPEAQEHYVRALTLSREIGNRWGEAAATGSLGDVFLTRGRLPEAREQYELLLALSREIGDRAREANALFGLGGVDHEEGGNAASEERLLLCLEVCGEIGHRHLEAATRLALGSLRAAAGGEEEGRESLETARDLAVDVRTPDIETLARCELALLPGGDLEDALAAYSEYEERLDDKARRNASLLLWRATGDRTHLETAKRLLDEALAKVPEEDREPMCRNLRLNREIMAAWEDRQNSE